MSGWEAFGRMSSNTKGRRKAMQAGSMGLDEMRRGYDEAKGYWKPQYDYGQEQLNAFRDWGKDPNAITSDPSYQFRRSQGQEALENSAAARGGALSGNALRAISDYGQESASQEYGNEFNRWMQKLGLGERATGQMSGLAERGGVNAGQMLAGLGQQEFANKMGIQEMSRADMQAQNKVIQDWIKTIFGGGGMGGK